MNRFLSRTTDHGGEVRRRRPWVVTTAAVLLGLLAVLVTVVMTVPVPTTATALLTLGIDGAQEVTLVLLVVGAGLALLAWRRRARVATLVAGLCAAMMLAMTAVPAAALWRTASAQETHVSLGSYLGHGLSLGSERPKDAQTLTYATVDGTALKLDYLPAHGSSQAGSRPAMVYVHGGGWKIGGREDGYPWGKWFTDRGYAVFTIDYRLLPHADWQTGPGDVKAAVGFVRDNAARFGVDPANITLFGESAGGHLAMMAAYTQGDPMFPPTNPHADTSVRSVTSTSTAPPTSTTPSLTPPPRA
ncbi:alpha/beta hydrolase fold domain-containing protein [Kitasatospora sp. NPDC101183]|uniref:alpha/beta hydrolase fold domain-containing protein n=1 Tax=Kitasatospora sp. NPDC101183 TaxID=3364100 RepID=UPI0038244410